MLIDEMVLGFLMLLLVIDKIDLILSLRTMNCSINLKSEASIFAFDWSPERLFIFALTSTMFFF